MNYSSIYSEDSMVELVDVSGLDPGKMTPEEAKIRFELACNDYVREPNKEAFDFICHNGHQKGILDLVQIIQPHVTAKEDETRLNALSLLVDVTLKQHLAYKEVSVLVRFLAGRLSDKYNVIPKVLSGLVGFVTRYDLDKETACHLAHQLFTCVDVQALHQDTRFKSYSLINSLLQRNLIGLLEGMSSKFVISYINMIDGEQDPRNLLLIFTMTVIILQHFNIDHIEETVFDVISCYFPIDFTPPEDSDVAVTPTDLKHRLNNCLKASNKLAKYTIPFLLEKFSSSLMQSRIQSCETLKICILAYGISCAEDHLLAIWNAMKQEIFGGVNRDLRERCLDAVSGLFWVLSIPNVKNKALDPGQFMKLVFDYCQEKLTYSESKYLGPTSRILGAIVKSSGVGSGLVAEHCLDWLLDKFAEHTEEAMRSMVLEEIVTIIGDMQCEPARATAAVLFFKWDKLQETFLGVLSKEEAPALCATAMRGIGTMLDIYHLTDMQEKQALDMGQLVLGVHHHLSRSDNTEGLQILTSISRLYPDIVNSLLIDKLLDKVEEGDSSARGMLSCLLVDSLFIRHSQRLVRLLVEKEHVEILPLFTVALSYQVSEEVMVYCQEFLFPQILTLLIDQSVKEVLTEKAVLLFREFTVALYKNRPRNVDMAVTTKLFTASFKFQPFFTLSPPCQTMLTAIYSSLLTYGSLECTFDPAMTPIDLIPLLDLCVGSTDPLTVRSVSSIFGIFLNRIDEGPELERLKEGVFHAMSLSDIAPLNMVCLTVAGCQGLIYRWETSAQKAVEMFVRCLTHQETHSLMSHRAEDLLSPIYQGNRMILYKQRFLLSLLPLIKPYIDNTSLLPAEVSSSLVRGVGALLRLLPQSLISTHGDTLAPIILHNLPTCDISTLKLVQHLLTTAPSLLLLHLDSLIKHLCALSRGAPLHVRVEAMRTLDTCTSQLHHVHTHVHQRAVLREMRAVLADRKRVVRLAAAQTLQKWEMLQP